jgi:hypothetical protein
MGAYKLRKSANDIPDHQLNNFLTHRTVCVDWQL